MSTSSASFFNGESTFSAQLNSVVNQAVARATLPVTQLQNQQSALTNQQSEVQALGNSFMSIQSAIDSLNSAASTSSYSAAVDAQSVATASVSTGALAGTYSLDVLNIGSQTNTISASGSSTVSDPTSQSISSSNSFTLSINGQNYSLFPSGNSLNALVKSINSSGANVQATIVNVGGSASPDYRLSIQSTQYAPDTIQLNDGTNDLLTSLHTGANVSYQINGQPSTPVTSTTRSLSLSTGLTANILTTGTANITVSQSSSNISNALSSLVSAYNSAAAEISKNRGQNGGALTGNGLILQLQQSLNAIGTYSSGANSTVSSLAGLGLTFDQNGNLQFNSSTFAAISASSPAAVTAFLGSETGTGFIQSAYSALTALTATTTGAISVAGDNIGTAISSLTTQISRKQSQVTQLQTNLTAQMAQADSAISSLQGQLSEITSLFTAETQQQRNITG